MFIQGLSNPSHVLRCFLANEYAFEIAYPNHSVRVAHGKGTWSMGKVKDGNVVGRIEVLDCFSGCSSDDEMTRGLYEEIQRMRTERKKDAHGRDEEAYVIEMFLRIWGGKPSGITAVHVVQPGRNAWVGESTGEFSLSPRWEEWNG